MRAIASGLLLIALTFAPATAQVTDTIKDLAGAWEVSSADRDQTCMMTFKAESGPGGFKLDFDKAACAAKFPPLKDVAAWNVASDAIRLNDARGRMIYDFTEVEDGMYESLKVGQPLTFLQSAAVVQAAVRTVEQTSGDWNIVRGAGTSICTLTLSTNSAGPGDLAVQVKPGCDAAVTRFGPAAWQIDRGELVLKSARGQIWRFEDANGAWQRVPTDADPFLLTRP
jgi:hypothetical protein